MKGKILKALIVLVPLELMALAILFPAPVVETVTRLTGTPLRGLAFSSPGRIDFESYENSGKDRIFRLKNVELEYGMTIGRFAVKKLSVEEIEFRDLHLATIEIQEGLRNFKGVAPAGGDWRIESVSIGKIFLELSASSEPIRIRNVSLKNLRNEGGRLAVDSLTIDGETIRIADGQASITLSPKVFADLRREVRWTFRVDRNDLGISRAAIRDVLREVEAQSQP